MHPTENVPCVWSCSKYFTNPNSFINWLSRWGQSAFKNSYQITSPPPCSKPLIAFDSWNKIQNPIRSEACLAPPPGPHPLFMALTIESELQFHWFVTVLERGSPRQRAGTLLLFPPQAHGTVAVRKLVCRAKFEGGTVPIILRVLTHFLSTTLVGRYHYQPHFTARKLRHKGVQHLAQDQTAY